MKYLPSGLTVFEFMATVNTPLISHYTIYEYGRTRTSVMPFNDHYTRVNTNINATYNFGMLMLTVVSNGMNEQIDLRPEGRDLITTAV